MESWGRRAEEAAESARGPTYGSIPPEAAPPADRSAVKNDGSILVREFLGTLCMVLSLACANVVCEWSCRHIAIAATVTALMYSLDTGGGCSLNPALTLALGFSGLRTWAELGPQLLAQLAASVLGGLAFALCASSAPSFRPEPPNTEKSQLLAELLCAMLLAFVFLNCSTFAVGPSERCKQNLAPAMGCATLSFACLLGISIISVNPAFTLGVGAFVPGASIASALRLALVDVLGAAAAAVAYRLCTDKGSNGSILARSFSEFLGVFFVAATCNLGTMQNSPVPFKGLGNIPYGTSAAAMTYALYAVSGAHLNPAVTLAVLCSGRTSMRVVESLAYVVAQLAGVFLSAQFLLVVIDANGDPRDHIAIQQPWVNFQVALVSEFLASAVVVYVYLSLATSSQVNVIHGLAVGCAYYVADLVTLPYSEGPISPIMSLSDAIMAGPFQNWAYMPWYVLVECGGGIFALLFFAATSADQYVQTAQLKDI